jgi:Predicted hydrolases or acyltransferases (alpha/beta hydrolase superfamily)
MKPLFLLFIALFFVTISHAQQALYGNNTLAGKYHNIRGIHLYVEEYGKGAPLILLHGNGGSIASMSSIIPYFSGKYHVIAIDSRAQGKSTDLNDSLSFEMMADDVNDLLDDMKIDSAYVIGWSDGGIVALEIATRHPEKVKKLASTGANLWPDSTAFPASSWKEDEHYYDSVKNIPKTSASEKNSWKLFLLDWLQPHISLHDIQTIQAPSLIICGDHDIIKIEHTVQIFQNIPHAQLWVVPHSGHATFIEHTEDFCKTVGAFFLFGKEHATN